MKIVKEGEGYRLTHQFDKNSTVSMYGKDRFGLIKSLIADMIYDQENAKETDEVKRLMGLDEKHESYVIDDKLGAI